LRPALAILVCAGALFAPDGAVAASIAVDTRSCTQRSSFFYIQILGDRDAFRWTSTASTVFGEVRDAETFVTVWSRGGPPSTEGAAIYGWSTATRYRPSTFCAPARAAPRRFRGKLRLPARMNDGWNDESRFVCSQRGRFVVRVRDIPGGKRVTVGMERGGELVARAEVTRGGGWLRVSTRCAER
jgi:hypothetical protein